VNIILIHLKRTLFALLVTTQILLAASRSHAQTYTTINSQITIVGDDLSRTVTTIQNGPNPLNRFFMTTVKKAGPPSVTINFKQEYGHVDYMFSNNHLHELEHPILTWLLQKAFK